MASAPNYSNDVVQLTKTLVNADSTNWVDVYDNSAGGTKSVRVESLAITSDDTATMNVQFGIYSGSETYLLGTARVVTLSGTDGGAIRVNAMLSVGAVSPDGIPVIEVAGGKKLQARVLVAVTAAKTVTISGWGRTYV